MLIKNVINIVVQKAAIFLTLILILFFAVAKPNFFLDPRNIFNIIRQVSVDGLVAFGETFTIIMGGIDLSVGSVLSMSAALTMGLQPLGVGTACATALLFGAAIGAFNGLLVTKAKILPFIATLGTMMLVRGLMLLYTRQEPIPGNVEWFTFLGDGSLGLIPVPGIVLFLVAAFFHITLTYARFGRNIYASGGNEEASRLAGIQTGYYKFMAYVISGLTASAAGIILSSRLNSSTPHIGLDTPLVVIAASIIGGASLLGGRGTIVGTLFGILVLGILSNGMDLLGVFTYYQYAIKGLILIVVVATDSLYVLSLRGKLAKTAVKKAE